MVRKRKKHNSIARSAAILDKKLNEEVGIIYSATALALYRYWGWRLERIKSLMDMTGEVWHECAGTNLKSMPQMLEEETGIEVQCGDGKSWHDLAFLNASIDTFDGKMTVPQFLYMRQQQLRWIPPNVTACILLSLYRRCGFGGDKRLPRIVSQIAGIREEFGNDADALKAACKAETGICVIEYMNSKEAYYAEA